MLLFLFFHTPLIIFISSTLHAFGKETTSPRHMMRTGMREFQTSCCLSCSPHPQPVYHDSSHQSEMISHTVVLETKLLPFCASAVLLGLRMLSIQPTKGKRAWMIVYACKPEITLELFHLEYICYTQNH